MAGYRFHECLSSTSWSCSLNRTGISSGCSFLSNAWVYDFVVPAIRVEDWISCWWKTEGIIVINWHKSVKEWFRSDSGIQAIPNPASQYGETIHTGLEFAIDRHSVETDSV